MNFRLRTRHTTKIWYTTIRLSRYIIDSSTINDHHSLSSELVNVLVCWEDWVNKKALANVSSQDIGVARILSGVHFFLPKKLTTFFLVIALKRQSKYVYKYTSNLTRPVKTVLKIDSCSGWGCTSCPGGALTHCSCKLRLKNFFTALRVQMHPLHPWLRLCRKKTNKTGFIGKSLRLVFKIRVRPNY